MKVPGKTIVPEIALDAGSAAPLQQQVLEGLRRIIVHGQLPRGMRLPATRQLARSLGVSRNTVLFAYEELATLQLTGGKIGSGTRVEARPRTAQLTDPDGNALLCRTAGMCCKPRSSGR